MEKNLFSKRLKELRTDATLSQMELAKRLKINKQNISDWETGKSETNFDMLIEIAKFFHVSTDYLLGVED